MAFLAVLVGLLVALPEAPRWTAAALAGAGLVASLAAAGVVSSIVARRVAELERQREAFYQEFTRLSKAAALGEIASSIAHDVNNPLAIMNEEAGWLMDLLDGSDLAENSTRLEFTSSLTQIRAQIKRASEFTRRVLNWGRDLDQERGAADVNAALTKTLYLLETDLAGTNVRVVRALDPRLPPAAGHEAELRQVFLHLMKNALDAMRSGGTLTIATECAGGAVRAAITDTGPGIPPDLLDRVFEPFFTTKPEGDGTGLGLPISTWIVQRAGGHIEVASAPGRGTTFRVVLPVAAAPAPARSGGSDASDAVAARR